MWTTRCNPLQTLFPDLCPLCRQPLLRYEQVCCLSCFCHLPLAHSYRHKQHPIRELFAGIPQVRDVAVYLFFDHTNITQTLIHAIKYYDDSNMAGQLGRIAAHQMTADGLFTGVEALLPVPLHPEKERKRGYNQSERIAAGFSAVRRLPIIRDALYRQTQTDTQTHKSAYERHRNVEEVFTIRDPYALTDKHVLLIYDVITTGATSMACIRTLIQIPHIRISLFFLAVIQ